MSQNIIGTVNGQELSQSEFDKQKQFLKINYNQRQLQWNEEEMQELVLDQLIGHTLLMQEAEKQGIKPTSEEIEQNVDKIRSQFSTEEEFKQALGQQDMTIEQLESDISQEISVSGYLEQKIPNEDTVVTDDEISAYYEQYKAAAGDQAQSLEVVKAQIEQLLTQQKLGQAINGVIAELKAQSDIEIY